jgi:hypothetical protein
MTENDRLMPTSSLVSLAEPLRAKLDGYRRSHPPQSQYAATTGNQ